MTQRPPAEWMNDDSVNALMRALGDARFVGGCVRDWLLDRAVKDIDIATPLLPEDIVAACKAAGIKTVPTGIDHGTVTAVVDGKGFEVTTLRKDVKTDGRHAVVTFSTDWEDDAKRRDFTVNALYADQEGNIYDPVKMGLIDIQKKKLRFVGEPAARIKEDYLRILRYFRFAAQLGWSLDDPAARQACRVHAAHINDLSKERVTQELLKTLTARNPAKILRLMADNNILPDLFAGIDWDVFDRLCDYTSNGLTRLSMLSYIDQRLVLSNAQKEFIAALREITVGADRPAIKKLIYYHGRERAREMYLLQCAQKNSPPEASFIQIIDKWPVPVFSVTGDDLIKQGMTPGPELGAKLKSLEEEWLEREVLA